MTSHIQLVERDRIIGLDGRSWSATPVNAWSGFPFEVHQHMRKAEVSYRVNPNPLILTRDQARGRSRIVSSPRVYELALAPGQVDVFPGGFEMDHGWWDCSPGEVAYLELRPSALAEPLDDGDVLRPLNASLSTVDPVMQQLVACIRLEVDGGCTAGRLYADGLSLAILGHLNAHYASRGRRAATPPSLSHAERRRIADYVEAHLGHDLRVATLAAHVALGSRHFIDAFQHSFGMTPHRYVTARRIEAAKRLLLTDLPIVRIAYETGFSNQAHFTATFHKLEGRTPARMRAERRSVVGVAEFR